MSSDTLPFPVISLADLSAGNLQKLGDDVVRACHDHGFLYIKDTGIPDALVDKMWDLSFKMFEGMSEDEKKKYTQDHNQLGYKPFDAQPNHAALTGAESDMAKMYGKMHWNLPGAVGIGNNDDNPTREWPPVLVENESLLDEFNRASNKLCNNLMSLIALGLRIPESKGGKDFFKGMHDYEVPNGTVTRLLYYPPLPDEFGQGGQEDGYTRIGAHCDIGTLTLLFQHSVGGLYVKSRSGEWTLAPPRRGHIIVNLGEELQVLSSGYLHATPHKVVATTNRESNTPRLSIAVFNYPTFDLKLVPWPRGTSAVIDKWMDEGAPNAGEDINWNGLGRDGEVIDAMTLLTDKYAKIYGFNQKWKPENVGRGRFATGPIGRRAAQTLEGRNGRL